MRISELPQEVKEKALEYQRTQFKNLNGKHYDFEPNTDDLISAFDWNITMEGRSYWSGWDSKKFVYDSNGVTKPEQYQIGIDTFTRAESNLTKEEILAICKFNIDKYNWRKKDQDKEDFKKIIDYANWAIKNF